MEPDKHVDTIMFEKINSLEVDLLNFSPSKQSQVGRKQPRNSEAWARWSTPDDPRPFRDFPPASASIGPIGMNWQLKMESVSKGNKCSSWNHRERTFSHNFHVGHQGIEKNLKPCLWDGVLASNQQRHWDPVPVLPTLSGAPASASQTAYGHAQETWQPMDQGRLRPTWDWKQELPDQC